jgi:hypothetical protein
MAYRRYRSYDPSPISLPGLVLIIVVVIMAFYFIGGHFGIRYIDRDWVDQTSRLQEYQPAVGPDGYATK